MKMKQLLARLVILGFLNTALVAQTLESRPAQSNAAPRAMANNDPTYLKLRNIKIGQETINVKDFTLKRDAGTFTFKIGTFYLLEPVNGKITGAVFSGDGSFTLVPPIDVERRSLAILTKGQSYEEQFSGAVFRFTDGTEAEIRKGGSKDAAAASGDAAGMLDDVRHQLKRTLRENLDARLLQDVMSSEPGGKFIAFIKGKKISGKTIYDIDPHGVTFYDPDPGPVFHGGPVIQQTISLAPEEVALITWDDTHYGIWAAFHFSREYAAGTANSDEQNATVTIQHQKLDTTVAKNAYLSGNSQTTFTASQDGVRVVPLSLFPTLRVESVTGPKGEQLAFIQEDREADADFAVILPQELKKGESYTLTTKYGGKDAISNEGGGNYYPISREDWYPGQGFGRFTTFEMTFHVPKGMTMVASGKLIKKLDEGNETVTEWSADIPQPVAGFNFGNFKRDEGKPTKQPYLLETYANPKPPDIVQALQHMDDAPSMGSHAADESSALGNMSTVGLMKKAMAEAQLSVDIYTDYFGEAPYKHLAMTQQTAIDYGQSWPGLVYLPITYFFDTTTRHTLGMDEARGYFKVVGPHEIAHQWWGHTVGFNSYRDQWMSEGFSDMSASIFLQLVYGRTGLQEYHQFWADQRQLLTNRNRYGARAIDVGPVTMGQRLNTAKTGFNIYGALIYPKGSYILQMIRFMMQDSRAKDPDGEFKSLMHDFTQTYANRIASTEDFKAILEKHMNQGMDLMGNHKMDWFFNEYVYGTAYPTYKFEHSFSNDASGDLVLNFKLAQSSVPDDFVMAVPVYLDWGNGKTLRLGSARMKGNQVVEQHVPLKGLKDKPKRATIAYFDDILANIESK